MSERETALEKLPLSEYKVEFELLRECARSVHTPGNIFTITRLSSLGI